MKNKKHLFFSFFLLVIVSDSNGQERSSYRYENDYLPSAFYKNIRNELRTQMPEKSVAFLFASPVRNRANDTDYPYHQNPNFYYLTGFTEPNCMLIIFKENREVEGQMTNEIIYISPRNPARETWTGRLAGVDEAKKITGITTVLNSSSFDSFNFNASEFDKILYLNLPSGMTDVRSDTNDLFDLVEKFKLKISYPPSNGDTYLLGTILRNLREIKKDEEIALMKKAISITCEGFMEMIRTLQPGLHEYQVEASGEFVFREKGAEDVGYNSICGAGENSCILHYETNRKPLKSGELILLDMGAEYHGYTADVTRTLPVNGKFTDEQKIIYNLVLAAHDSAFTKCKPGNNFRDPHNVAVKIISQGLLKLGIIKSEEEYRTYFMHGTSHYLGLDVHDPGSREILKTGNVITVEPGIYIYANSPCDPKWWNIGIRIEDDILITENGYVNLSDCCPVKIDEIEKAMQLEPARSIRKK